ncbi:MAG: glycosyltransferase family 4 protein [Bacteroidota bacterium]|jgi:UDP-GlcNAc:undecaprenyl-phosphate GlcNAc-1-phosphate transferase
MLVLILVFITSFMLVLYGTPALIKVAILKRLFDEPGGRKIHKRIIPTIGGIIIFSATLFSFSLWFNIDIDKGDFEKINRGVQDFKLIVATMLILFFIGVKDDIIGTSPIKKLIAHVVVGLMLVLIGNIRITGLHGIFGVYNIPEWAGIFLSLFTYVVVVNGFNLIDGVDGLASGVGLIACSTMGAWFIFAGDYIMACLAFALAGSLTGFLIFNFAPAKIFMGDSGSLCIGLIVSILSIKLIEYPEQNLSGVTLYLSKPVFAMATLIYPLVDTLRIFIIRAMRGQSPFSADKNHLHHRIMDCGLGHKGTVIIIYFFSLGAITVSLLCYKLYNMNSIALGILIGYSAFCMLVLELIYRKKNKNKIISQKKWHEQITLSVDEDAQRSKNENEID